MSYVPCQTRGDNLVQRWAVIPIFLLLFSAKLKLRNWQRTKDWNENRDILLWDYTATVGPAPFQLPLYFARKSPHSGLNIEIHSFLLHTLTTLFVSRKLKQMTEHTGLNFYNSVCNGRLDVYCYNTRWEFSGQYHHFCTFIILWFLSYHFPALHLTNDRRGRPLTPSPVNNTLK